MNYVPAKYTEVLVNLIRSEQVKPLIDKALSTYPIYVSTHEHTYIPNIVPTREEINEAILNHYKYREIAFETVGRFLDELEISMKEIMPYYNQLMYTQDLDFNVIYNVDYVKTIDRQRDTTTETTTESQSSTTDHAETNTTGETYNKNVRSDTPQGSLSIGNKQIDEVDYATEVTWDHNSSEGGSESSGTSTGTGSSDSSGKANEAEGITETTKGNYGVVSAQDLVKKYRETILNIVQMICNDKRIAELFMTVY